MRTSRVVGYIAVALAFVLVVESVELCQLIFTSEPRAQEDLAETRPYLIQVPDQPITVFYDDGETIKSQSIDGMGSQTLAVRDMKDMMTFGISTFKDQTSIYLAWQNRPLFKIGRVVASYPFDSTLEDTYTASTLVGSSAPVPVAVAASQDSIAFIWIAYDAGVDFDVVRLARSANAGQDFADEQLKYLNPMGAAITFVQQTEMYGERTFLGVYQETTGGTHLLKLAADDVNSAVTEQPVTLLSSGQTMALLSIAAMYKAPNFVVTGQVQTSEGAPVGVLVAVFDSDFNVVKSTVLSGLTRPSLYITPVDEIYISYMNADSATCIQVFEDPELSFGTMEWCSEKYPLQDPSWSGLMADADSGYMAMTVVKNSQSVVDLYKCNFGCGNGVISPIRGELCEVGSDNCDTVTCNCVSGSIYVPATQSCVVPQAPQSPPVAPPTVAPTSPPPPSTPVAGSVADVLPILDCNARLNQTHFRTYLSYDTRSSGVQFVNVPVGEKNMFTPIAPNQGQPVKFFAGRSTVYNTAVDIAVNQPVDWILTKYRLSIAESESNKCPSGILFQIGITSPNPPTEPFINATVDYVAWLFNVSSNNVSINVTQGEQPNEYVLNVSVQVAVDAIIAAIEQVRAITEDTTGLEDHIKDLNPDVTVTGVRGRPTGVDNPAVFEAEPTAGTFQSSSRRVLGSVSLLVLVVVAAL